MAYSEGDKMLLASLVMMDVLALQYENEIRKEEGKPLKYGERDFFSSLEYAEKRLSKY